MAYLEISLKLAATGEFSLSDGWLRHGPSRQRFETQYHGHGFVDAETWQAEYGVPLSPQFTRHVRLAGFGRQRFRGLRAMWSRPTGERALAIYGRAFAPTNHATPQRDDWPPSGNSDWPQAPPPVDGLAPSLREREEAFLQLLHNALGPAAGTCFSGADRKADGHVNAKRYAWM